MKILISLLLSLHLYAENTIFWWLAQEGVNFGDHLSKVIVERILEKPVLHRDLESDRPILLAAGSILHYARTNDVIWGAGFREDPTQENRFSQLDVRLVRGPKTREFLLQKGIACPENYGDPAILMAYLFPEFEKQEPETDYIIIPNLGEMECFSEYKNVVLPILPWQEIIRKMMRTKLVISSSLHGIIVAESYGVPARLLKMTWVEPLLKYEDYYASTGRTHFRYATSVQEAIEMGGEKPAIVDIGPILDSFPWDYFDQKER